MQNGDYGTPPYFQYPNLQNLTLNPSPNPVSPPSDRNQSAYASAPPFSTNYGGSDYPGYATNYPPYSQNPDPVPASPTAPLYNPQSSNPNLQTFNPTSQPPAFPPFESHVPYQSPSQPQSYNSTYDHHQTAPNYVPPPPSSITTNQGSNSTPSPNSHFSSVYSAPFGSLAQPAYENPYESSVKFDQGGGYADDRYGGYGRSRSDLGPDLYGKRPEDAASRFDSGYDDGFGEGVYAYQGGKVEPYGARGTAPKSSTWSTGPAFDDYGRPINIPSKKDPPTSSLKVVRAIPKVEAQEDVKNWVQKFRVKLLAESGGQSTMDVLCQVGLDGIRMLDPNSSRTLRIYPLETITRCEVYDSSTLAFWSKSSVDIEPRRIRLQSNKYTTNTLLDTVTAATVQFKEMGGRSRPSESVKAPEQPAEKKKGLVDWVTLMKPGNEEKDHWVPDEAVTKCTACGTDFGAFVRRHHCRNCGDIFCDKCTQGRTALTTEENAPPVRVCDRCMAEVTHRLTNAKELASKPAGLHSHEDLAKKLKDEMERNRWSSGNATASKSDGSGKRMKEVACPTCTVHLQVQVPSSGSETIECGVCQHPFLVSAH
ncbi:protein FREE1-like [Cucurbita pepo subsp. pepo]|uniref:protein FREE1-like n=1 Tax=Cucurbita pepo subsp. pepo TaxID=3664 RepID=UPI000C9D8174|nr:protein FREE1-like [Cucurbita pepo subsp. pepo]